MNNDIIKKAFIDGYLNGDSDCELELPRNPYSAFDEWSEEIGLNPSSANGYSPENASEEINLLRSALEVAARYIHPAAHPGDIEVVQAALKVSCLSDLRNKK